MGIDTADGGNASAWADFDNDGDLDLMVAVFDGLSHRFHVNNGDGSFSEEAVLRGVDMTIDELHKGSSLAVGDYNKDGYLDFFISEWGPANETLDDRLGLFLNEGESRPGYFQNVAKEAGISPFSPDSLGSFAPAFTDLDGDSWPDLVVAADFGDSQVFWNNADGTFTDGTEALGLEPDTQGMGIAIGDINLDGALDWFVTSISYELDDRFGDNALYLGSPGERRFTSFASQAGVAKSGWSWGAEFLDYDNDGFLDLVVANADDTFPIGTDTFTLEDSPTRLFRGDGSGTFVDVGEEEGLTEPSLSAGIAPFDFDRDGDIDIFVLNEVGPPLFYRNEVGNQEGSWLRITLEGILSHPSGAGSRIEVQVLEDGPVQLFDYSPYQGYLSQLPPEVHVGLGVDVTSVHRVSITWPSGVQQSLSDVSANQALNIVEDVSQQPGFEKPEFTLEPERQILRPGDTLTLSVEVEGEPSPTIRWFRSGELLEGESETTLTIPSVSVQDAGRYYATATNAVGVAYSEHARISVRELNLDKSVARQWMDELLNAIRLDYPAPTVHSRNLFSLSAGMWDAWTAYDESGLSQPFLADENPAIPEDPDALAMARREAVSYAAYRILKSRFRLSPSDEVSLSSFTERMRLLGYDSQIKTVVGDSPAAVGNRIAAKYLARGWIDAANEKGGYVDQTGYEPMNEPLVFKLPGVEMNDPNRWQPLAFDFLVLQNGIVVGESVQVFLGSNWGGVRPFALERPSDADVYNDPGAPPYLGADSDEEFKLATLEVIEFSSWMDPSDGVMIDVSPAARHNNTLGTDDGEGYPVNPYTGEPYETNEVLRADYGRILAEFWADGPDSETPPGHWNTVANYVSDNELFEKRFEGSGPILDDLEWDVKLYFALNGAVSDAAIACWDAKRKYDYVRPISMIRYMGGKGQSTDPDGPSYDVEGLPLSTGLVEVITEESAAPGERHEHLADHLGEIAVYSWRGIPENPSVEFGGVGWIRAVKWMPYQRDTFVTPPFGAYTSGHSTFSRAAAEVLAKFTGDAYFPGGISSFSAKSREFLEFESGPEEDITLTWATYFDASDEAGISRLYGGIHTWPDDLRGRIMGSEIGIAAYDKAKTYFDNSGESEDWEAIQDAWVLDQTTDPNQPSDSEDFGEDVLQAMADFYFGGYATERGSDRSMIDMALDQATGVIELQTTVTYTLSDLDYVLEVSNDLSIWTPVANALMVLQEEPIGDGRVRVRLKIKDGVIPDSRFGRIVLQDTF
ncbi:MAG: hypothetical protein F6K21_18565 [Symploca sp. SIO2D2]|nr:hypothetical protein [Symploca sp. SIO2D2]